MKERKKDERKKERKKDERKKDFLFYCRLDTERQCYWLCWLCDFSIFPHRRNRRMVMVWWRCEKRPSIIVLPRQPTHTAIMSNLRVFIVLARLDDRRFPLSGEATGWLRLGGAQEPPIPWKIAIADILRCERDESFILADNMLQAECLKEVG